MYRMISCAAAALLALCIIGGPAAADDDSTCAAHGDGAIDACTRVLTRHPRDAQAWANRGMSYKHDPDRAIADLSQAIRLDPKHATYYNNRALAFQDKGDLDRAITDLDQAIRLDPKDATAYENRGVAYADKGDYERAAADLDEAVRLNPTYTAARNFRDRVRTILASRPSATDDARICRNGSGDDAIAACDRALKRNPKDAAAWSSRGAAYAGKSEYGLAIADLDPFTQALLDHLETSGLEIGFMFRKVHDQVLLRTRNAQEPFTYGALPGQEFHFRQVAR
jgi:tetratricopeptide (TPR) repeat protein